ncbi:unnamed protein product, partial [Closterium sp. NIES-53]
SLLTSPSPSLSPHQTPSLPHPLSLLPPRAPQQSPSVPAPPTPAAHLPHLHAHPCRLGCPTQLLARQWT